MSSPHTSAPAVVSPGVRSPLSDLPGRVRIAVDCMGGDHGPSVTLPACKAFLDSHPEAELVLVGLPEAIAPARGWARVTLVPASEVVTMDDPVEVALRKKRLKPRYFFKERCNSGPFMRRSSYTIVTFNRLLH